MAETINSFNSTAYQTAVTHLDVKGKNAEVEESWCYASHHKFHGSNYDLQLLNVDSVALIALSVIVL